MCVDNHFGRLEGKKEEASGEYALDAAAPTFSGERLVSQDGCTVYDLSDCELCACCSCLRVGNSDAVACLCNRRLCPFDMFFGICKRRTPSSP